MEKERKNDLNKLCVHESSSAFDTYIGKKIHLYLKNKFYYSCKILRIRELNKNAFIEIYDFKTETYNLIAVDTIAKIEEVRS